MCFDFLSAYLQPRVLSLFSCELQRMMSFLFFVVLCYSSSFPITFFFILEYYICFSRLPWSVTHGATHMEGVSVELILEVGIFSNNFEL